MSRYLLVYIPEKKQLQCVVCGESFSAGDADWGYYFDEYSLDLHFTDGRCSGPTPLTEASDSGHDVGVKPASVNQGAPGQDAGGSLSQDVPS